MPTGPDHLIERFSDDQSLLKLLPARLRSPSFNSIEDYLFVGSILVLGCVIYFQSLGSYPIQGWDEGVYGTAAKHAVTDGYWLVPHLNWMIWTDHLHLQPFLEKPPLVIWLQAASMQVFGINEFAVRFQSAAFTILTGLLVYFTGRSFRGRKTGFVAALVFLSTPFVWGGPNAGRFGGTDMAHTFFGSLFVVLVWQAIDHEHSKNLVHAGVVGGIATLVKGFAVGIFGVVLLPVVIRYRQWFQQRATVIGVSAGAAIALPWPLYAWVHYGDSFVREIFVEQVLERAVGRRTSRPGTTFEFMNYPYFEELPVYFDPWIYFVIPAIAVILWRGLSVSIPQAVSSGRAAMENDVRTKQPNGRNGSRPVFIDIAHPEQVKRLLFLIWWGSSILVIFAFTGNHPWYILPAYVPGGLLVGWLFATTLEGHRSAQIATVVGAAGVLLYSFRVANVSPLASPETPRVLIRNTLVGRRFVLLVVGGIGLVVIFDRLRHWYVGLRWTDRTPSPGQIVAVLIAVAMIATMVGSPPTGGGSLHGQQEALAESLNEATASGTVVYVHTRVMDGTPFWTFAFYLDRPLASVHNAGLNHSDKVEYAVIHDSTLEHLEQEYRLLGSYDNPRRNDATAIRFLDRRSETATPAGIVRATQPYIAIGTVR